jgi:flavodoxin
MQKILILYYSRTGNTGKMADAVAEEARAVQGVEVELKYYATPEELADFDAVVVGIPTYHHEMTIDVKKLFEEAAVKNVNLKAKTGAAFGSYGYGVVKRARLIQTGLEKCRKFGREIAERFIPKV